MSALATIESIVDIKPIEGADFIQMAQILSWPTVVKKGEYNIGDKCVFVNPDTLLPRANWNQFLWPKSDQDPNGKKIRLRTAKFKGQLSMGLVVSCDNLPPDCAREDGKDVSELLGVEKYESNLDFCSLERKGNFPAWLRVSDEDNVLGCPRAFDELKEIDSVYISTKHDGSSGKASLKDGVFQIFSRRQELHHDGANPWSMAATKYQLEEKLRQLDGNHSICFECCGPKLNGNKLGLKELQIFVYDIWDIDAQKYIDCEKMILMCDQLRLLLPTPIYLGGFNYKTIQDLQKDIDDKKYSNGEFIEGVVCRSSYETWSPSLKGRLSWKLINSNFAAKYL